MTLNKITLNDSENFDGIVEKITIKNDVKSITIEIKQWNNTKTYCLSTLKFNGVIFQSLPDISSFNLITEIIKQEGIISVSAAVNKYIQKNTNLILNITKENILNKLNAGKKIESYFLESGYCTDWLIVCEEMTCTEKINLNS